MNIKMPATGRSTNLMPATKIQNVTSNYEMIF